MELDPQVERDFELARALAPYTIGITGLSDEQKLIWDANDTGTSAAFQLTATEEGAVRGFVEQASGDPSALVPLERQGDVS